MRNNSTKHMLTFFFKAMQKWVANQAGRAAADGVVVDDLTFGCHPTGTRTWVNAGLSHTGLVLGTIGTDHTLRPTVRCAAIVARLARADGVVVDWSTHAVRPTGRRDTRVGHHRRH